MNGARVTLRDVDAGRIDDEIRRMRGLGYAVRRYRSAAAVLSA
jgi:hypothetical protein